MRWVLGALLLLAVAAPTRGGSEPTPGVGVLLVARQGLPDPNFSQSVVLLVAYDAEEGAAGVVINRPTEMTVGEASRGEGPIASRQDTLYIGGPVGPESLIVLWRQETAPNGARFVLEDVHLLEGEAGVEALRSSEPAADRVRFYAGYAGWAPGQLENEIARGDWHLMAGESRRVFSARPEETWDELVRILLGPRA